MLKSDVLLFSVNSVRERPLRPSCEVCREKYVQIRYIDRNKFKKKTLQTH